MHAFVPALPQNVILAQCFRKACGESVRPSWLDQTTDVIVLGSRHSVEVVLL